MAIVGNVASEIGDIIRIQTDVPIVGIVSLTSFVDDVLGTTGTKFFDKSFRWSTDGGMNFTGWYDLTVPNIQNIVITRKNQFVIDYRYVRTGVDPTGDLSFNNLTLSGDFQELPYPIYRRNIFNLFFDVNDVGVLSWALNVLEKIYNKGILPDSITRKWDEINPILFDEDFTAFFNSITHFFAVIVHYARQYEGIATNTILLPKFLESLGLYFNNNTTDTHLQYLFTNYPEEFSKRGTSKIADIGDVNTANGELLRLVNYVDPEEIVFALLEPHTTGWCISKSSPSFNHTRHCTNMVKGYEKIDGFEDSTKYPTSPDISAITVNATNILINAGAATTINGIHPLAFDVNNAIKVSPTENYEISLRISQELAQDEIFFGVKFYDEDGIEVSGYNLLDQANSNFFFEAKQLPRIVKEYFVSGIIFNQDVADNFGSTNDVGLNIGYGGHLRFNTGVKYVMPFLYTYFAGATSIITISDFKLRPLEFNFSLGKFGLKNIIYLLYKNNSIYSDQVIVNNTVNYLIPYNANLIDKNFVPLETITIPVIPTNGRLYNYAAVTTPNFTLNSDWAVASNTDWDDLATELGGAAVAGGALKETGQIYWDFPNAGATNSSGFTALGSGSRSGYTGVFSTILLVGSFWTSTAFDATNAYLKFLSDDDTVLGSNNIHKNYAFSVRLIWVGVGTPPSNVLDVDGNFYDVIQIGTQYWLKQNWACTKLNDGTPLTRVTDNAAWAALSSEEAYCEYNNNPDNVYI